MKPVELLGLIISFIAGIVATFLGFLLQEWVKTSRLRKSIAKALLAEATASRDHYMGLFGTHLEQTPEAQLPTHRATFREYQLFPIFESLSSALGMFPKDEAAMIARAYTEAGGFVQTLRNFCIEMARLDELALNIQKARLLQDRTSEAVFVQEHAVLHANQLAFWVEVRRQHRRVTGELFQELRAVLERYAK